jgi:hypothetical protein
MYLVDLGKKVKLVVEEAKEVEKVSLVRKEKEEVEEYVITLSYDLLLNFCSIY